MRVAAVIGGAVLAAVTMATPSSAVASHAPIEGSGSSWAGNAVNQWVADTSQRGLEVVNTPNGNSAGKADFANNTTDFAVSDVPYFGLDTTTGIDDSSDGRAYASVPLVGGGESFPYQIRIGGEPYRGLRLSPRTLVRIFTNKITNWDDPEIKRDNNGLRLPNLAIIPVVHSEGSAATYYTTAFFNHVSPKGWQHFASGEGATEYFPTKSPQVAENGSAGVMNYVASKATNGAIGMDESLAALSRNYPVASVRNAAHYYVQPSTYNVSIALQKARVNQDASSPAYLEPDLSGVYSSQDSRAYPLSFFASEFVPTSSTDSRMNTPKRQTLNDFTNYAICGGQKEVGAIGYAPLPLNLVRTGFQQLRQLRVADPSVDTRSDVPTACDNPTFKKAHPTNRYLRKIAPKPPPCDKAGHGPCATAGRGRS